MANLKDILRELLKDNEEIYSISARVNSVDVEKRICDVSPINGDADIFNVRLQSKVSDSVGLVLFPVVGSDVTVTFFSKELAFVSQTSTVENIVLNIGDFSLFIDSENFNKSVKNIEVNTENHIENAENIEVNTTDYALDGDNVKFDISSIFEVVSEADIKLKAIDYLLEATNVNIKGITDITGATTITGLTTVNGATMLNGAATVSGDFSTGGGSNGGIPKSNELAIEINKVITEVNKIKTMFSNWSPVLYDGGMALKALTTPLSTLSTVSSSNISNPNATH